MSEPIAVATLTATFGEWTRSPQSVAEGDPPHYLGGPLADPRHPNELGIIWADRRHIEPDAVEDYDGCRAPLIRVAPKR